MLTIEQLWTPEAEKKLREDMNNCSGAWILAYNVDLKFIRELLAEVSEKNPIKIIGDRTQRRPLGLLAGDNKNVEARIWSRAWVMHSKVIILPSLVTSYIGSANLTPYSFRRAMNLTLRIEDAEFTTEILDRVVWMWAHSQPLE